MAAKTILAVEDEPICQQFLRAILKDYPVELHLFAEAEAALGAMAELHPDLVFMDVILPDLDGIRAIERLRRSPEGRAVPVVVTSSLDDTASRIEARVVGASSYLPKPIDPVALGAVLERFLGLQPVPPALGGAKQATPVSH